MEEEEDDLDELNRLLEENNEIVTEKMTDDDLAEIMAISRKMLHKKSRREIIDASYNRYNYPEDPGSLPKWFVDDEKKHIGKIPQVTKEDVIAEKERLRIWNKRLPKKVMEAKMRRKNKMIRSMMKAKNKAKEIFENDSYSNFSKARQIN